LTNVNERIKKICLKFSKTVLVETKNLLEIYPPLKPLLEYWNVEAVLRRSKNFHSYLPQAQAIIFPGNVAKLNQFSSFLGNVLMVTFSAKMVMV